MVGVSDWMTQIIHSITSKIDIKNVCCAVSLVCFTWVDLDLNIVMISLSRTTDLISLDQMVMIYWPKNKEIWHISLQNESRAFMVSLVWGSWIPIKGLILQVSDQSFLSSVMSRSLPYHERLRNFWILKIYQILPSWNIEH